MYKVINKCVYRSTTFLPPFCTTRLILLVKLRFCLIVGCTLTLYYSDSNCTCTTTMLLVNYKTNIFNNVYRSQIYAICVQWLVLSDIVVYTVCGDQSTGVVGFYGYWHEGWNCTRWEYLGDALILCPQYVRSPMVSESRILLSLGGVGWNFPFNFISGKRSDS